MKDTEKQGSDEMSVNSELNISSDTNINTNTSTNDVIITPKKIARVFLLEQTQNVDITPALEYGSIIPLFKSTNDGTETSTVDSTNKSDKSDKSDKFDRPSQWDTKRFTQEIIKQLENNNYDPEVDYLLVAGHVIPLVIFTCSVVGQWENVQMLFWSSGYQKYVMRRL